MKKGLSEDRKRLLDFRLDVIKTIALILGGLWIVVTFSVDEAHKMATAQRDLLKPYYEKKLALYLEASSVAAHLSTNGADPDKWRDRFFELYWGELGFVGEGPSIEALMVEVCSRQKFPECHLTAARPALELARKGRTEIFNDLSIRAGDELSIWKWLFPAPRE